VIPTYPGVYIEELPSGVHPITGVATAIAAFVGFADRGPVDDPVTVQTFAEFTHTFGGLSAASSISYAVAQFFVNGGSEAVIVRAPAEGATPGTLEFGTGDSKLQLEAASPGEWSGALRVRADLNSIDETTHYNLWIKDTGTGTVEVIRNLALDDSAVLAVAQRSELVRMTAPAPVALPKVLAGHEKVQPGEDPFADTPADLFEEFTPGDDGTPDEDALFPASEDGGMYTLARADLFNLLCIPPVADPLTPEHKGAAAAFCRDHRALFIVDGDPAWTTPKDVTDDLGDYVGGIAARRNAALYVPYFEAADPLKAGALAEFPPCGVVAGVMARTDATRGVWKAPAGLDAGIGGIRRLKARFTDGENGRLNPLGVNCLRTFPAAGSVVWGARTLEGDDRLASEWKYVPVRRTALFIEESLYRGTRWVVFEPNDEPLWAQIRLNVGAFMQDLFLQGAFQGTTPREAYLVKCDKETTTQTDIDHGVVNILVGFAPLKPAEFVIVQIQQLAGQIET
jgi:phage tail sheath protein FI